MPKVINFFYYWYRISFDFLALWSSVYWRVTLKWVRHLFQSKKACSSLFLGTQELFSRTVETAKIRSETVLFYQNLKFVNVFDLLICFDLRNTWLLFTVPYVKKEILIIQFIHILGWKFVIKLAARMVLCVKITAFSLVTKMDHSKFLECLRMSVLQIILETSTTPKLGC